MTGQSKGLPHGGSGGKYPSQPAIWCGKFRRHQQREVLWCGFLRGDSWVDLLRLGVSVLLLFFSKVVLALYIGAGKNVMNLHVRVGTSRRMSQNLPWLVGMA